MVTLITSRFLEQGCTELQHLAQLHELSPKAVLICGTYVAWESTDSVSGRKQSKGSTLFGVLGKTLYRDRGFATPKPVTAEYYFSTPKTNTVQLRNTVETVLNKSKKVHGGIRFPVL